MVKRFNVAVDLWTVITLELHILQLHPHTSCNLALSEILLAQGALGTTLKPCTYALGTEQRFTLLALTRFPNYVCRTDRAYVIFLDLAAELTTSG
jgi:hypothetical protein